MKVQVMVLVQQNPHSAVYMHSFLIKSDEVKKLMEMLKVNEWKMKQAANVITEEQERKATDEKI